MLRLKWTLGRLTVLAIIGAICASVGPTVSAVAPSAAVVRPRFEPAPCPFTPAADQVEGRTLTCGFVVVPENRTHPAGRLIGLAVAVFKSPVPVARPPLIFLGGGPGTFIVERFGPGVSGTLARDLTDGRDFIVFDQRGVGFSRPSLACPELVDVKYQLIQTFPTREQETDALVEAASACRDRLVADGTDLSAYTTRENAADVNDIRVALGYDRFDVWGLSYGTRLALRLAENFPHAVRSLVLESALPPSVNQVEDRAANTERALRVLFNACAADVVCAAAYPDLETVFYNLVADLNRFPAHYLAQHPRSGELYNVVLTGDRLIRTLVDALTDAVLIPYVPIALAGIRHGDFTLMAQATSLLTFDDGRSAGTFYSINCADEVNRTSAARVLAAQRGVRSEIAEALNEDARFAICAEWGAADLSGHEARPVASGVPTLILAGEFDPLTPPVYGAIAGRTLRRGSLFEFPGIGHDIQRMSPCAHAMLIGFLANPTVAPDASCIADMQPPAWIYP